MRQTSRFIAFLLIVLALALPAGAAKRAKREIWPTPVNPPDLVRVIKSQRVLEVWRGEEKVRTFKVSLGGNPVGHKQQEGDGRTPEGRYLLNFRKSDSVAYKAIHISYPSPEDRSRAKAAGVKPGGSIMIHGQWNGYGWLGWLLQDFDWTNGCIGLSNTDMDELWDMLAWNTPIEIVP